MKLTNPLILRDLRRFYFNLEWTHSDVQTYLKHHYNLEINLRTLKRWKKCLLDHSWQGPKKPKPPTPKIKATPDKVERICNLRKKTGYGSMSLKYIFNFDLSESTYKRLIKSYGYSRGSKIENQRIHWVKWQRAHPDSLWQLDGSRDDKGMWLLPAIDGSDFVDAAPTRELGDILNGELKEGSLPKEVRVIRPNHGRDSWGIFFKQ